MENIIIDLPEEYELVKNNDNTYSIKKKEFKLEAGKDYYQKYNDTIVIDRKESECPNQLGFSLGRFEITLSCRSHKSWREATKKEVEDAFEKELVRRYGKDWENAQLKNNIDPNTVKGLNSNTYTPSIVKNYGRGWDVWNKNGLLYYDGKWAEVKD